MSDQGSSIQKAIADQFDSVETTLCLSNKVVVITEDRLELLLQDGIAKISSKNTWIAPAGILASCVAALTTATFRDFAGVKAGGWQAVFILIAVGSSVWLCQSLWKRSKRFGRPEFMDSIKVAGTRLNYSETARTAADAAKPPERALREVDLNLPVTPVHQRPDYSVPPPIRMTIPGMQKKDDVVISLQCRHCGQILTKGANRMPVRCPKCGLLN